jgi:hypothetical protein
MMLEELCQGDKIQGPDETSDYVLKNFPRYDKSLKNKPELAKQRRSLIIRFEIRLKS